MIKPNRFEICRILKKLSFYNQAMRAGKFTLKRWVATLRKIIFSGLIFFFAFFHINLPAEVFDVKYQTDGTLLIMYNAQIVLHLLEIVDSIHNWKNQNPGKTVNPHVVLFVWDCKAVKNKRHCNEDTSAMTASMYRLQRTINQHSQIKPELDRLKQENQINQSAYEANETDLQYAQNTHHHLKQMQSGLMFFADNYYESHNFLEKLHKHLNERSNKAIKARIAEFKPKMVLLVDEKYHPLFEKFLNSLQFLLSENTEENNELSAQLRSIFAEDHLFFFTEQGRLLFELVVSMNLESMEWIHILKNRKSDLADRQNILHSTIAQRRNNLLEEWKKLTEQDHREQLSFIESIPAFSFSFKIYPLRTRLY